GLEGVYEDQVRSSGGLSSGDADSESPFISFDEENDGDAFKNSSQSLHAPTGLSYVKAIDRGYDDSVANRHQEDLEGIAYRRIGKILPSIRKDEVAIPRSNDWALV